MSTLAYIVVAAVSGGILATLAAAATLALHARWISRLVSFAVGALLGAVFIELLPHALEEGSAGPVMITVLIGLLSFFLLEKLVLWRHAHGHEQHRRRRGRVRARPRAARASAGAGATAAAPGS